MLSLTVFVGEPSAVTLPSAKAVADKVLKLYFEPERGILPREGEIDLSALAQVIAMMAEKGALKPPLPTADKFVDQQYLSAADVR